MKFFFAGLLGLVISAASPHYAHAAPPPNAQLSMLVAGKISVSPEGKVIDFSLEETDKLPPPVVKLLSQEIPKWLFEPPTRDGKAVALTTSMTLRVVSRSIANKKHSLELGSATFGDSGSNEVLRSRHQTMPKYPDAAIRAHVSGTVYLVVNINKEGHVQNIAAQQVNLLVKRPPDAAKRYRHMLAQATIDTARKWRFGMPTTGKLAGRDHWIIRIPIKYALPPYGSEIESEFGRW